MATEADGERVLTVNIYDTHASNANFKVKPATTAAEICKIILSKRDILSSESKYFSVVLVVTAFNAVKKVETHCLRTLKPNECLLEVQRTICTKMISKCGIADESKLENSAKWYFKDMRSNPIDLGSTSDICGEYDSDEDEEISHSDLSYLAKSERKGFLLKRSNTDFNLWRRWYCVLMDQLWCVDTAQEIARAKCVHLSGMIRYREGQKTLDQLQIIIINSADGKSHFFRAFNLIDQKKWLQDLNIKTRVAADNDTFAMAEMIITDEVDARCFRLAKQLDEVLDQPKVMEAIALRRAVELSSGGGVGQSAPSPASSVLSDFTPTSRTASMKRLDAQPNVNFMLDTVQPSRGTDEVSTPTSAQRTPGSANRAKANATFDEYVRLSHPRGCSCLPLENLQICERVEGHHLLHELHKDSRVVTEVMLFVLDVQRYREALRIDLKVPVAKKQQIAKDLYLKHIVPQLQHADLEAYPDFQHEMMQLGGGVTSQSASKIVSPSSPSRLSSLSSKAASAVSPPASRQSMRSEYSSRVRNRSFTSGGGGSTKEASAAAPPRSASVEVVSSAFAAINWGVDVAVLMRVHTTLFEMHQRAVELQNGLVTQDPVQLLRYSAGTSKFRGGKDRPLSSAAAPVNGAQGTTTPSTTSSSYWPWFGFASSASNSAAPSPAPSRKGSDAAQLAVAAGLPAAPGVGGTTAFAAVAAAAAVSSSSGDTSPGPPVGIAEADAGGSSKMLALEDPSTLVGVPSPVPSSTKSPVLALSSLDGAEEASGLKAPPVTLFDEVVGVLIQKLS
jgi:hypothetical protein